MIRSNTVVGSDSANNSSILPRTVPSESSRHTISVTDLPLLSLINVFGEAVHGISNSFGSTELSSVFDDDVGADALTFVKIWNSSTSPPKASVTVSAYPQTKLEFTPVSISAGGVDDVFVSLSDLK